MWLPVPGQVESNPRFPFPSLPFKTKGEGREVCPFGARLEKDQKGSHRNYTRESRIGDQDWNEDMDQASVV